MHFKKVRVTKKEKNVTCSMEDRKKMTNNETKYNNLKTWKKKP